MVLRSWRCYAGVTSADQYPRHLLDTVRPKLERLPGFLGLYLLRQARGPEIEYCVQTLWESMGAIEAFAGSAPELAVVEPAAAAMLIRFDREVRHYEVLAAPWRSPKGQGDDVGMSERRT